MFSLVDFELTFFFYSINLGCVNCDIIPGVSLGFRGMGISGDSIELELISELLELEDFIRVTKLRLIFIKNMFFFFLKEKIIVSLIVVLGMPLILK